MKHLFRMSLCVLSLMLASMFGASVVIAADAVVATKYEAAGNQLYQSGDFAKAIQYYQAAIQLDASKTASYVGLGNCQYRLGRKEEALTAYNKALALDPTNAQLTQFVNNLKGSAAVAVPASAPAPALGPAMDNPLKQGADLFAQKRYVESIPLFEQAASKDPGNAQIQYYWAYACAMARDNRGAALHFYKFNMMSPNPGVQTYADRLKAGLPPEDQRWVEAQLAGATNVARNGKKASKKFGIRLVPTFLFPAQTDMKNYAKSVTANIAESQAYYPLASAGVTLPTGYMSIQVEPCYAVSPNFELALSLSYSAIGDLKTSINYGDGYSTTDDTKYSAIGFGVDGRYFFGTPEKKLRPFVGAGLMFASVKADATYLDNEGGSGSSSISGSAAGFELQLGLDYALSSSAHLGPIVGYRVQKVSKSGSSDSGDGLDLDMGGPMAGIMLSAFF